jgi:hypothetical protein
MATATAAPDLKLVKAQRALEAERCRRSAAFFVFDSRRLRTKDEHDNREPVKPVPDKPYLRVLLDCYLVSGRLLEPDQARAARDAGLPPAFLELLYQSGVLFLEKSRDLFVTNLTCAYLHWRARVRGHQLLLIQSKNEEDAAALVFTKEPQFARISFMEDQLPGHLRQCQWPRGGSYGHLYFPNGSHIRAIAQGGHIIRSEHPSVIVSDEAAFQPEFGSSYTAALPAVEGGGQYLAISSAEPGEFETIVDSSGPHTATAIPGLTWRLASGSIPVLRLHYAADPDKRPGTAAGDAWRERATARYAGGIRSARWRKEMEIEYGALGGTRLFPEWELWATQGRIVVPPFDAVGYRLYGSYDHGWTNPASFHVHGVNGDGDIVTLWEFYADRVPVSAIARLINGEDVHLPTRHPEAKIEPARRRWAGNPYAGRLVFSVADPSMWAEDQPMADQPNKSTAYLFRHAQPRGVFFLKGERGGDLTVAEWLLGTFWADPARPRYRVTMACPWLIWELGQQRHREVSPQVGLHTNNPEGLVDKDNHAWDDLKMFLQRFPPTPQAPKAEQRAASFMWWRRLAKQAAAGEPLPTYRRELVS